ncbi:MAG: carboxymuconolactone decarboxylase family protein [Burkholderiaceae bacterium]|nr:carboxymuconolactone decarboxylase family protein [Burkholderiaceae bacterium]
MSSKSYQDITRSVSASLAKLRADIPQTTRAFSALAQTATAEGALDKKTKELIAMALAVGARCDACVGFHAQALVKLGTSRAELEEALGMAIYMGGGPSLMYAAEALSAYEEFGGQTSLTEAASGG